MKAYQFKISVIIVNYNVKELLLQCLQSIYANTYKDFEIILVDNNSVDGSAEAVQQQYSAVKIIANKYNAGFSGGNNQGFAMAKGEYIFLLNPDTELQPNVFEDLLKCIESNEGIGIVGPKLLNSDGTYQASCYKFPTIFSEIFDTLFLNYFIDIHNPISVNDSDKQSYVDSISGAAMFFKRSTIDILGEILDEKLFWSEDLDLCYRVKKETKLKVCYYPQSKITHHLSRSARQNYRIPVINQMLSRIKFFEKHNNRLAWIAIVGIYGFQIISKILLFLCLSPFKKIWFLKLDAYCCSVKVMLKYLFGIDKGIYLS